MQITDFLFGMCIGGIIGMVAMGLFVANDRKHISDRAFESLAELEHWEWSRWITYMLANMTDENMSRWKMQSLTAYCNLSEADKERYREKVRKIVGVLVDENF